MAYVVKYGLLRVQSPNLVNIKLVRKSARILVIKLELAINFIRLKLAF
jgi:hypothetical protein